MSQLTVATVTSRLDVYLLCPDVSSFRITHPRPLRGVWELVNNDFGSYKRKQWQHERKRRLEDGSDAATDERAKQAAEGQQASDAVTDEQAYAHTRKVALDKRDAELAAAPVVASARACVVAATSIPVMLCPPVPAVSSSAVSELANNDAIKAVFGDTCFPWAYWASQDSIAESRLTGYCFTEQQWLSRVLKLIDLLGDQSQLDSWHRCGLARRPFIDRHIVEAGRTAALPSRPDVTELVQRRLDASVQHLERYIDARLASMETHHCSPPLHRTPHPTAWQSLPSSHQVATTIQPLYVAPAASVSAMSAPDDGNEQMMVDCEEGPVIADCSVPSPGLSASPSAGNSARQPVLRVDEQAPRLEAVPLSSAKPHRGQQRHRQQQQSLSTPSSSACRRPSQPRRSTHLSVPMARARFDNVEFTHPRDHSTVWQLTYRGKGTFAQVYEGRSHAVSERAAVAIKFALDPSCQSIDMELMREAEMMACVALVSPSAVCQLVLQPLPDDPVVEMQSGGRQPVFIAMELVDCELGKLQRSGLLSRCALCEASVLCLLALQAVHASGVLHRDLKLNNLGLCIDDSSHVESDSAMARVRGECVEDGRVAARVLDLGEAVVLRAGEAGPTEYGQCRSEYASLARHAGKEQGYKDDVEMLLYAFLDKLMACGLPWKPRDPGQRKVGRDEMMRMKADFRRSRGEQSEVELISMLTCLDGVHARAAPAYDSVEAALRTAWQIEWTRHESGGRTKPRRLYDCIQQLRTQGSRER